MRDEALSSCCIQVGHDSHYLTSVVSLEKSHHVTNWVPVRNTTYKTFSLGTRQLLENQACPTDDPHPLTDSRTGGA